MMKLIATLIIFLSVTKACFSQSDSLVVYLSDRWQETTPDSAYSYIVFKKDGNNWKGKRYDKKNNTLKSDGSYFEAKANSFDGEVKSFLEDGVLDEITLYEKGHPKETTYFYKNGSKKSYVSFGVKSITKQAGWDENGNEIPGFVVQREARFKGGISAWVNYLQRNLKAEIAIETRAPAGRHVAIVEFLVNKAGEVSEVKAVGIPPKCSACAIEAVRVVSGGPNWEPALLNNEPVIYRQRQSITFEVTEEKKRRLW